MEASDNHLFVRRGHDLERVWPEADCRMQDLYLGEKALSGVVNLPTLCYSQLLCLDDETLLNA